MRKNKMVWTLILLFGLQVQAGPDKNHGMGNGGDAVVQEFVVSGVKAFNFLKRNPNLMIGLGKTADELMVGLRKTTVLATNDTLILNGVQVNAINYPSQQQIIINRQAWTDLDSKSNAQELKVSLALHEYLFVLGIDDIQYKVSAPIISQMLDDNIMLKPTASSKALLNALCEAVYDRDVETVKSILQIKFNVNQSCDDKPGKSLYGKNVLVDLVQRRDDKNNFSNDDLAILNALLQVGADPNVQIYEMQYQDTLLSYTIRAGLHDISKLFIQFGADPNTFYYNIMIAKYPSFYAGLLFGGDLSLLKPDMLEWYIDNGLDIYSPVLLPKDVYAPAGENVGCYLNKSKRSDLVNVLVQKLKFDSTKCAVHW